MKRRRKSRKRKITFVFLVAVFVLIIYGFIVFDQNIKPTILALSEVKARMIATQAVNDAIKSKIKDDIKYQDLIFVKTDNEGKITMMQANTVLMNSIASDVALEIQNKMRRLSINSIDVPLGNAFDSQLLAQFGPRIKMNIVPQGTVSVDFATEFKESGINQTIHKVFLIINTNVRIIVPLASETVNVTANVPIAETIIIGDVPENYIYVPEEEFLNVVPTD